MNPFLKKIVEAAGLTRLGQVSEATTLLQRALKAAAATASQRNDAAQARSGVVLDGLVREVAPAPAPSGAPLPAEPRAASPSSFGTGTGPDPLTTPPFMRDKPGGRGGDASAGGFVSGQYASADGARNYKLFVPSRAGARDLPLVVMLHGCTQDPDDFAAGTRMNELGQAQGFFVLYPAQGPRSNAHKCWNWFNTGDQRRGAGEPSLIAGMTRQIMKQHPIDPARVYVAGLSAGGAMAAILAREYPDLYAAAGIHSGLAAGAAHDVASAFAAMKTGRPTGSAWRAAPAPADERVAVPVIVFHGDADTTVAPANAEAVIAAALGADAEVARRVRTEHAAALPDAAAARGRPADRTGIGGVAAGAASAPTRAYERTIWMSSAAALAPSLAELWRVRSAPHAWSGGSGAGTFTDPAGPDASREMVRFFFEHPLQAARNAAHA